MKKGPMSLLQRRLSAMAPGNWRATLNKHSRLVNSIAVLIILLVIVAAVRMFSGTRSGNEVGPRPTSGPQGVSTVANQGVVLSQSQVRAIKLPPGMFLAQVPFRHDPGHIGLPKRVLQAATGQMGSMATREPPRSSGQVGAWILAQRGYMVHLAILPWVDFPGFKLPTPGRLDAAMVSIALDSLNRAGLPWPRCQVRNLPLPGRFVMALCRGKRGNIWVATEDHGVFRYNPSAPKGKQIQQFTKQSTHGQLGNNNIYALACDNHGRIWAGTLNRGVSVWNGKRWQDYGVVQNPKKHVLAGPLGDHVFALKFDQYTDQMWACTDAGVSIYQCSKKLATRNQSSEPVGCGVSAPCTYPLDGSNFQCWGDATGVVPAAASFGDSAYANNNCGFLYVQIGSGSYGELWCPEAQYVGTCYTALKDAPGERHLAGPISENDAAVASHVPGGAS